MKKFTLLVLVIFIAFSEAAFGAVSNDMSEYVRKDVLEERDRALIAEIRLGNEKILREIDGVRREMDKRFNEMHSEMDKHFNEVHSEMNKRFAEFDKKIAVIEEKTESTKTTVYWGLGFLGLIIVFAPDILERIKRVQKPSIPIDEIEKIFDKLWEKKYASRIPQVNQ